MFIIHKGSDEAFLSFPGQLKVCEQCARVYLLSDGFVLEDYYQDDYIEHRQFLYHLCSLSCLFKKIGGISALRRP